MKYWHIIAAAIGLIYLQANLAQETVNAIEAGTVNWNRDYEAALVESKKTGRPVFMLFQEIPGCSGCQKFGAEVLSNKLLVEAIEDEFVPVLVYNNRKSNPDAALLEQFDEPAWNYQVVRFLDSNGKDIIPRKARVWDTAGIAGRAIQALEKKKRNVPRYLRALHEEHNTDTHAEIALAMSCFWTGEQKLGNIEGVIKTEAGWLNRSEVVRVTYNKKVLSEKDLIREARALNCAREIYREIDDQYRKADRYDQKKQLSSWREILRLPGITPMQLTKINALAPVNRDGATQWLSPRQKAALKLN